MHHKFFETVVPGKIFVWADHMPNLELANHHALSLDAIKKQYFGANTLAQELSSYTLPSESLIAIDYLNLEFFSPTLPNVAFFPMFFIKSCQEFKYFSPGFRLKNNKRLSFNCPMHNHRYSRIISSCWLCNNPAIKNYFYTQNWQKDQHLSVLDELLQLGGLIDWTHSSSISVDNLPYFSVGDYKKVSSNQYNFFATLENFYSSSVFSTVMGTSFWENGSMICEKYLQAVYGGTVPICDGYGIYDSLEKLGFDTFKDIIDISYQYEKNPILRVWSMFEKNRDLLTNALDVMSHQKIMDRLEHNLNVTRNVKGLIENSITGLNSAEISDLLFFHKDKIFGPDFYI